MRNVLLILYLSFIATASSAHIDGQMDEKGGHWNYRLGTYHQHYDFEGSMVDGTYDWDIATDSHTGYRIRFYRLGFRTYQLNNGKHAFGVQGARQLSSEFDYGSQWSIGVNYRRRYSKNTTITYSVDYYRAGKFNVFDFTGLWGIYVPQISKKLSLHTGFLFAGVLESDYTMFALSNRLEYDMGICIMSVRYDMYYDMAIYSTGLTYKF